MSLMRVLYYALWIAPVPVFVLLALLMYRRKLHRDMPIFFTFALLQLATFAADFFFYHRSQTEYFYTYWVTAALGIIVSFGVLYEIFTAVFRPFSDLREFGAVLFRWAALVLAAAALLMAATASKFPGWHVFAVILNGVRSVEVMQCGLVLLMLLCSAYLGITLHHRIFGIALGFGLTAAVDLIVVTVFANFGLQSYTFLQLVKMVTYNLAALLWLGYVHAGELERQPTKQFSRAEQWNYALASAIHPGGDSPALPRIEDTVERVWRLANGHSHETPSHSAD